MTFKKLAFLVLCAAAIPAAAIANNYRSISIEAAAEDDCPYVYGSRHITAVDGVTDGSGHHVLCTYK